MPGGRQGVSALVVGEEKNDVRTIVRSRCFGGDIVLGTRVLAAAAEAGA
jgi:hypothetical protein